MSKENIYSFFGEKEQLERLEEACKKLEKAAVQVKYSNNKRSFAYLVRKLANVEFLTEQIKDFYHCEEEVYCRKGDIETELIEKYIKNKDM